MKGLMQETKICTSTAAVIGCDREKIITDFPKTKHGRQAVCKKCVVEHIKNRDKAAKETSPETKLYSKLNEIWR